MSARGTLITVIITLTVRIMMEALHAPVPLDSVVMELSVGVSGINYFV